MGAELFLYERAFEDCLERIELLNRSFERALLIGCRDPSWADRLRRIAADVDCREPGAEPGEMAAQEYDLVLTIGALDSVNELPLELRLIHYCMRPDSLFIGALSGGDTLPQLRAAMRAADALAGGAAARAHPRIEPSALAPLLTDAGFTGSVVDVERVQVSYPSLERLIADLRAMAATNILTARGPALTRRQRGAAIQAFADAGVNGRTTETFEILHFAAWTPRSG